MPSPPDAPALIAVVTTLASPDDARRVARALVERRLVACAQIEAIESVYVWKGAVQTEPEWRLTCKTLASRYDAVEAALHELHGYELPAIHAVAVQRASAAYAAWVAAQVGAAPAGLAS